MAQPITTQDIDIIYSFYQQKFDQSRGTDAYFMLSKIEYSLMQIRPIFDKTIPELQARFCQDLYSLVQMPNYCINCLKFIDGNDLQQRYSRNTCPICAVAFCSGFCSTDAESHPCEVLNKIKLRSLLFYPEIATIKLRTEELVNESKIRLNIEEELCKEVCKVKVDTEDVEEALMESEAYMKAIVVPEYRRLYNSADETKKEQAKRQVDSATDPFLFPYFVRICKLYSDNLVKLRANGSFIERGIVDIMQATKDLTQREIRLINGFNELLLIIHELDENPHLARVEELAKHANSTYEWMISILTVELENEQLELPTGVRAIIDKLYGIIGQHVRKQLYSSFAQVAEQYTAAVHRLETAEEQMRNLEETNVRYEDELQRQDRIVHLAEERAAQLIEEFQALEQYQGEGIFSQDDQKELTDSIEAFKGLKERFRTEVLGTEVEDTTKEMEAKQDINKEETHCVDNENEKECVVVELNLAPKKAVSSNEATRVIENGKATVHLRQREKRASSAGTRIPLRLHEAQIDEQVNPHQNKLFTRRIVFLQDAEEDFKEVKATISLLQQELRSASEEGVQEESHSSHCFLPRYVEGRNIMERSRSLRRSLEEQREVEDKIMSISSLKKRLDASMERSITLDTRLLRPYYREFINQLAIEDGKFKAAVWRLLTMIAFLQDDVPNHTRYAANLKRLYGNLKFRLFCHRKRLWMGYNAVCENVSVERMELEEREVTLGSESLRRLRLLSRGLDNRVLSMPDVARREVYQKLRRFVFDLFRFDDFEGVLRVAPVMW